jgi:Scavenger mRNA decapping enzyme C-term binding/AAA domain
MSDEPHPPKRLKPTNNQPHITPHATMIILVGLPGAGKSTFSTHLIQQSPERWTRVNQDSVKNGKRGTRDMCIDAATSAIRQGINVIIDRTNISPDQRKYFIDVAINAGIDPSENVHCVFLNLPTKACGARAADRNGHEGGVFGPKAYGTVGMMQKALMGAGPPTLSEGFASILECQNDADLDAALQLWVRYTTQIFNKEENVLNLSEEWEKVRPKKGKESKSGCGSGGSRNDGLQRLDKFFTKNTASKIAINSNGTDGSGTSAAAVDNGAAIITMINNSKPNDAFSLMMTASKQKQQQQSPTAVKKQAATTTTKTIATTRHHFHNAPALYALQRYLRNPEQLLLQNGNNNNNNTVTASYNVADSDLPVLYCDSQCIIIPDKFPKSRYHILVLARDQRLQGPLDLTIADSAVVQHMKTIGIKYATEHYAPDSTGGENFEFSVGFHSVPSMRQLHLHVLSKDYDSVNLKNKKHWNSFTTPFFLDVDWVVDQLESLSGVGGSIQSSQYLNYDVEEKERLLKQPMRCPKCRAALSRMPDVKAHVAICTGR